MNASEKLFRVAKLCEELQHEDNEVIVQSRIQGLAQELKVSPFQCALIYWAIHDKGEFESMFGSDVKVRFRAI